MLTATDQDQHDTPTTDDHGGADGHGETIAGTHVADDHHDDVAHGSILDDTNTWVLVSFLIVVGLLLWQNVPKLISKFFADRATTVRTQLDEARTLREEAQRLLADYQKRQREAEDEADAIVEQARRDAKLMTAEAREKMNEQLTRRRKAAEERIARAEAQAIAEIRGKTADLSVAAAKEIIGTSLDGKSQGALVDTAISDLRGRLN